MKVYLSWPKDFGKRVDVKSKQVEKRYQMPLKHFVYLYDYPDLGSWWYW